MAEQNEIWQKYRFSIWRPEHESNV